jgi:hypothetical protein
MDVRVEEPERMNVLGLFLAEALRRSRARPRGGSLEVGAGPMRARATFTESGAVVARATGGATATVEAPLHALVAAIARPGLRTLLRLRVRGSRLFALRALFWLRP